LTSLSTLLSPDATLRPQYEGCCVASRVVKKKPPGSPFGWLAAGRIAELADASAPMEKPI
jgi:hypothetical protein